MTYSLASRPGSRPRRHNWFCRYAALLVMFLCLNARPAGAWGVAGHHIVASIAWSRLSPTAQARIRQILNNGAWDFVQISTCPDLIRDTRPQEGSPLISICRELADTISGDTGPWHYIDVPLDQHSKNLGDYCPGGNCVLQKLKEFEDVLSGNSGLMQQRTALMFVVHLMGDVHQPLHCVERQCDRGGNLERVDFVWKGNNEPNVTLHHVWDTSLVNGAMLVAASADEQVFANQLGAAITRHKAQQWSRATVDDMVWEGVAAAKRAYHNIPRQDFCLQPPPAAIDTPLSLKYEIDGERIVREQLMKAGVRLAAFLEKALGNNVPAPAYPRQSLLNAR